MYLNTSHVSKYVMYVFWIRQITVTFFIVQRTAAVPCAVSYTYLAVLAHHGYLGFPRSKKLGRGKQTFYFNGHVMKRSVLSASLVAACSI